MCYEGDDRVIVVHINISAHDNGCIYLKTFAARQT